MGRNAAGESFLRGYIHYTQDQDFWVQVDDIRHAEHFASLVRSLGRSEEIKAVESKSLAALAEVGVVYYPGPGIGTYAWHRAAFGHASWSLCGITHTTSSAGAMDALAELITAPVQPWDALICTSHAVKNNVTRLLQAQIDYLKDRLGITRFVLPQMPVIPLGLHTDDFVFTDEQRAVARDALGVDDDTLVVMYMGRLSFHAKAHPLAMYQALETAASQCDKRVVLLECGWHANESVAKAYAAAAGVACPKVQVRTLDGRNPDARNVAWAAADVFCSLSDNIQGTFGIVPIEAMAAGLPVVVSDWDGYKDTVRDGVDGFRIPTIMPAGLGGDLALRHALKLDTYDHYCGHTCSLIAVDIEKTAQAFTALFASSALRKKMGAAGRQRAQEVYDWRCIIPQYEAVWKALDQIRQEQSGKTEALSHPWPARMDPFAAFAAYPTQLLQADTCLSLVGDVERALARVNAYRDLAMVNFAAIVLPSASEVETVLRAASPSPKAAQELVRQIQPARQVFVFRALAWLVKLGVLRSFQ